MQWDDTANAGFSTADAAELMAPVVTGGKFGFRSVNVRAQQRDEESLLRWFEQLIRVLKQTPEIGSGTGSVLDLPVPPSVLVHRFDSEEGAVLLVHNLADSVHTLDLSSVAVGTGDGRRSERPWEVFADGPYPPPTKDLGGLEIGGFGFRWIRLRHGRGPALG